MNKRTYLSLAIAISLTHLAGCTSQQVGSDGGTSALTTPNKDQEIIFEAIDVKLAEVDKVENQQTASTDESLWEVIANNYTFANDEYPQIQPHIDWLANNQSYMDRITSRGERYLFYILEEVEQRGLPYELALLPAVESAFNPHAYSHSHAAGLWQFIPSTGKQFGLKRDWWVDQRRDVIASTQAALGYLQYLHARFDGDWLLALAAYNCGEGTVSRAIKSNKRRGKPTDFWSLKLPRETRGYVPRLLALAKVIQNPNHYGLTLPQTDYAPYFDIVALPAQISLPKAAQMADTDIGLIEKLNPAYKRRVTHPQGPHRIVLPTEASETFQQNLASEPVESWKPESQYIVKRGDSLYKIARVHHLDIASLRSYNNLKNDRLQIGQRLTIPGSGVPISEPGYSTTYTVKRGDSLWNIARQHNVTVTDIKNWNNMVSNRIKPGKQLLIEARTPQKTADLDNNKIRKLTYKVKRGDSLSRIASKFYLSIGEIIEWNKISRRAYLRPGQVLVLFVDTDQL